MVFLMLIIAVPALAGAATVPLQMYDLGTLGGKNSFAMDINDKGQVVGWSNTDAETYFHHAFLWENGRMIDLGHLGGGSSYAYAINELGQVVGESSLYGGGSHAFLWEDGEMTDLGTLGGESSTATGINDQGDIVGVSDGGVTFLWRDGTMHDLGMIVPEIGTPDLDINNYGQIIAGAFLWENGKETVLGDPDHIVLDAQGINDHGHVVGWADVEGKAQTFLWQNGTLKNLQLAGRPTDINNNGQIVGSYLTPSERGRAFVWQSNSMVDLGTLGGEGSEAYAINEVGEIVGSAETTSGKFHAALWTTRTITKPPRILLPFVVR